MKNCWFDLLDTFKNDVNMFTIDYSEMEIVEILTVIRKEDFLDRRLIFLATIRNCFVFNETRKDFYLQKKIKNRIEFRATRKNCREQKQKLCQWWKRALKNRWDEFGATNGEGSMSYRYQQETMLMERENTVDSYNSNPTRSREMNWSCWKSKVQQSQRLETWSIDRVHSIDNRISSNIVETNRFDFESMNRWRDSKNSSRRKKSLLLKDTWRRSRSERLEEFFRCWKNSWWSTNENSSKRSSVSLKFDLSISCCCAKSSNRRSFIEQQLLIEILFSWCIIIEDLLLIKKKYDFKTDVKRMKMVRVNMLKSCFKLSIRSRSGWFFLWTIECVSSFFMHD